MKDNKNNIDNILLEKFNDGIHGLKVQNIIEDRNTEREELKQQFQNQVQASGVEAQTNGYHCYLVEDLGWVDSNFTPVDIGTWDKKTRIAKLYPNQTLIYSIFIQVNNAVVDGCGSTLGNYPLAGINVTGYNNIVIKNFKLVNTDNAIYLQYAHCIEITAIEFINIRMGIIVINCDNCKIKNNKIYNYIIPSEGIRIERSTKIFVKQNKIVIGNSSEKTQVAENSNAIGIRVNFSSYCSLKENIFLIKENLLEFTDLAWITKGVGFAGIVMGYSNDNEILKNSFSMSKNTIIGANDPIPGRFYFIITGVYLYSSFTNLLCSNEIKIIENRITTTNGLNVMEYYGICLDDLNNINSIKANKILISQNENEINSDMMMNFIQVVGIELIATNMKNEICLNELAVKNNKAVNSFAIEDQNLTNKFMGIELREGNNENTIKKNTIFVLHNINNALNNYINKISLIHLERFNDRTEIEGNQLCNSQGNGITLEGENNYTFIMNNLIKENNDYGIYLGNLIMDTNYSKIMHNCIINNWDYGLYIEVSNPFNEIIENNFCSYTGKNAYDENVTELPSVYDRNYWSDWSGKGSYNIPPVPYEDKHPAKCPLKLPCMEECGC